MTSVLPIASRTLSTTDGGWGIMEVMKGLFGAQFQQMNFQIGK